VKREENELRGHGLSFGADRSSRQLLEIWFGGAGRFRALGDQWMADRAGGQNKATGMSTVTDTVSGGAQ
jgi:hypothetical protein